MRGLTIFYQIKYSSMRRSTTPRRLRLALMLVAINNKTSMISLLGRPDKIVNDLLCLVNYILKAFISFVDHIMKASFCYRPVGHILKAFALLGR